MDSSNADSTIFLNNDDPPSNLARAIHKNLNCSFSALIIRCFSKANCSVDAVRFDSSNYIQHATHTSLAENQHGHTFRSASSEASTSSTCSSATKAGISTDNKYQLKAKAKTRRLDVQLEIRMRNRVSIQATCPRINRKIRYYLRPHNRAYSSILTPKTKRKHDRMQTKLVKQPGGRKRVDDAQPTASEARSKYPTRGNCIITQIF